MLAAASSVLTVVHVGELLEPRRVLLRHSCCRLLLLLGVWALPDEGLVCLLRRLLVLLPPVLPVQLHLESHGCHLVPQDGEALLLLHNRCC